MKYLPTVVALMLLAPWPGVAQADPRGPVVVELFTSQGCNSCPPADALLGELAVRDDILALTYNVDYWDYLGWKDTLASRVWTERQHAYRRSLSGRYVYTPQLVIGGRAHVVGSDRREALRGIADAAKAGAATMVLKSVSADGAVLAVSPRELRGEAGIFLVRFDKVQTVAIGRGENAGRTIAYHHVVRRLDKLKSWRGEATEVRVPADLLAGEQAAAVFIQADGLGAMLGAVRLPAAERRAAAN